jgi:cell division protein FtsI (penicillin-binding protein 3)
MGDSRRSRPRQPQSDERLVVLGLALVIWALVVAGRLFGLQVVHHEVYRNLAESQQDRLEKIDARRGSIFDHNGNYLALTSASKLVVVSPKRIPDRGIAAAMLARVFDLDAAKLEQDLNDAAASKYHRGYLVVDPHVSDAKAEAIQAMKLDWVEVRDGSLRSYPNGQLAAHVIGNVNSEGRGAAGVELKLEKELAGTPGLAHLQVDVKQRAYAADVTQKPVPGKNIGLTIDSELQHVAEDALKASVISNHADHGSLVAMDPYTGEIRALANYPTYNLNERLHTGEKPHGREDLAVVAPFEPGSVFKVVTISAAMETTNLRPGTFINCGNGVMTLFSRVIHDTHAYPVLPVEDVLAKSSNIGAIRIGMQVGNKNLYDYIRRFGFGRRTGIELPAEAPGMLRPLKRWQPTSIGSVPMGHEISVTSIQLAQLGAVIANGGYLVHPHVVAWKQSPGSRVEKVKLSPPVQVLRPETIGIMRNMMHKVTMPGGTAQKLHVPGYTIAGKTGTAQIYDYAHHVYTHKYNASFLGFAPYTNPRVVIIVTVSGTTGVAGFGGAAAGPVFESAMATALRHEGIPRDVPEEIEEMQEKALIALAKRKGPSDKAVEMDTAELATPFTEEELKEASGDEAQSNDVVVAEVPSEAPKVPNFVGMTVRDVAQEAAATGLDVDLYGEGLARAQRPVAGALLQPGAHIAVRFAR